MIRALSAVLASLSLMSAAGAEPTRETLGYGRLFTNDYLGDNQDRWRTGSYAVSKVTGFGWSGRLPNRPGDILEYRFRSEILAPSDLTAPPAGDRRWAGVLSAGIHTHFQRAGTEISAGLDLIATGPQTGLGALQEEVHRALGATVPAVLGNQIPDGLHPTLTLEFGRPIALSDTARLRPFAEIQAGAETLVRLGGDLTLGGFGQGDLMLRDVATGHRMRAAGRGDPGLSLILGGDIAHVAHSVFLPEYDGYRPTEARTRLRAGLHWQGARSSVFYGLTWLGEEFQAQPEGQVLGSVRLNLKF